MKTQMIIGGILFGVAACTAPADGYRITGNIEGAGDGKAILLQSAGFEEPTMGDTVNMRNGKFVFEGRLESPVSVTVKVCPDSDQPASLGFIAENSPIRVMAAWKDVIERYGYRSIGGQTVEGSLNQEVYEKIAGVYGQILKAPEHKEYAEAQQKMAGLRNTDTEAYYKLQDETEPLSERFFRSCTPTAVGAYTGKPHGGVVRFESADDVERYDVGRVEGSIFRFGS